jgi:NAD(P)H dehydrogenase (quinone)
MILVTGAQGNFGKAVINYLFKKGISPSLISGLVRDKKNTEDLIDKGISLKVGDYDIYSSLVEAFKGVDKLLLVSSPDVENRLKQQGNVVNAAKEAGVKHIIYTSTQRKNETVSSPLYFISHSHIETENLIKTSGLVYTIFRNNLYLDVLPTLLGKKVLDMGVVLPAGNGKTAFALRNEMAEAAANVLTSEGHENKEYFIGNSENISMQEITDILSEVIGKKLTYTNPPMEVYIEILSKAGVPMEFIQTLTGFAAAINNGEFESRKTDLEMLLGRKPTSTKAFLEEVFLQKK